MKKRTTSAGASSTRKPKSMNKLRPSRKYIHSLRGTLRGKGLMKALMAEKQREREL